MKGKAKDYALLHILLAVYSFGGVCGKLAAGYPFLSIGFCVCYGAELLLLAGYAFGWQQILKRLSLTAAYSQKGVTLLWGLLWGVLFFSEPVTPQKLAGILLVLCGIVLYAKAGDENG